MSDKEYPLYLTEIMVRDLDDLLSCTIVGSEDGWQTLNELHDRLVELRLKIRED